MDTETPDVVDRRFATIHHAPIHYIPPNDATHKDVSGLLRMEIIRDPYGSRPPLFVCTWTSRSAFDSGAADLLRVFGTQLVLSSWGHVVALEPRRRWWRSAWESFSVSSKHFWALILGCVTLIATCNSVRDSYGAFFAAPKATFRDPSLRAPNDPSRKPHDVLLGESMEVDFAVTNVSMTRGNLLVARVDSLELVGDDAEMLTTVEWEPETLGHLPLSTGSSHSFRATILAADRSLQKPMLRMIRASAIVSAGEWRSTLKVPAETEIRVWPPLKAESLGPTGDQPVNQAKAMLGLDIHFGRAAESGVHVRVSVPTSAGFQLLDVQGLEIGTRWPRAEHGDLLEWNVPPQTAFRTSRFILAAVTGIVTTEALSASWHERSKTLVVDVFPGNPELPK